MGHCHVWQQPTCTCGFSDPGPTGLCLLLSPLGQHSFWAQDWFKLVKPGRLLVRTQWVSNCEGLPTLASLEKALPEYSSTRSSSRVLVPSGGHCATRATARLALRRSV